jgi:hypothetical protein
MRSNQNRILKGCENLVQKILKQYPQKYRQLANIILKNKPKLDQRPDTPMMEVFEKIVEILKENSLFITELNKLLHQDLRVPQSSTDEKKDLQSRVEEVFKLINKKQPNKFTQLCNYLKENNPSFTNGLAFISTELYSYLERLLSDQPEFLREIQNILNEFSNKSDTRNQDRTKQEPLNEQITEEYPPSTNITQPASNITKPMKIINSKGRKLPQSQPRENINQSLFDLHKPSPYLARPVNHPSPSIPTAMKNEMTFIESLRGRMSSTHYDDLIKCLFLYSECIITSFELFKLTKEIFIDFSVFNSFKDIILFRENSRRKATNHFKPLSEIDFSSEIYIIFFIKKMKKN